MTAVVAQKYGLKFDINFCNNSSSRLPFCLKIWSLLTLFKTNIRWILFSSLIIYLFILIKWVLISLGKQTLRWYMRHGIYLCHHLELQILLIVSWLVAMQTVLHVKKEHRDRERERERPCGMDHLVWFLGLWERKRVDWRPWIPQEHKLWTVIRCLLLAIRRSHFQRRKPPRSISMHMGQSNPYSSY